MMEKGDALHYRGKNLDDINVDGLVSDESDGEYSDISCPDEPEIQELPVTKETQIQENIYNFTEAASEHEHEQSTHKILKSKKFKKPKEMTAIEKPVFLQKCLPKVGKKSKFIRVP